MALTKVTLSGAVDTIKESFTKVNDLIDDLLSTSNGLGASQIGMEDVAENFDAANLEDFGAEIYTNITTARSIADAFDENSATTTGLTWGYKAGTVRIDNVVTAVAASTIALTDDATNYVELNTSAVMTKNTTAFTSGYIPVRQITCASGSQTVSTDKRSWFNTMALASATVVGIVELATDAETITGSDTARAITPANLTAAFPLHLYNLGADSRAKFTHVNDTDITIEPASYRHNGTINQMVYWASQLTYTFASLGTSDWSYLYLDDSAIVTADTNVIAAGQLTDSVTEPSWSAAKRGWYNGEDKCIFAVLTDGDDDIVEFFHDGGELVLYAQTHEVVANQDIDNTWVDISTPLWMPSFSTKANIRCATANHSGSDFAVVWRTNGQTNTYGHTFLYGYGAETNNAGEAVVITDSGQLIELKMNVSNTETVSTKIDGWYFPIGL